MSTVLTKINGWISDKLIEIAEALRPRPALSVAPSKFIDLAPTDEADPKGVYSAALKFATDSSNVSNIALTGPYGSGKSSIIRSFLKSYPRQPLRISLAAFLPEATDKRSKVNKQEIERSILQQLLYGADADKLPLSRFKRIQTPGIWSIFRSLYILAGLLTLWHIFDERAAIFDGSYFEPFDLTNWLDFSVFAFALVFLWSAIHHFYVASFGVSLKSISLKDIQIRPYSEDQDSILNRHLDEIIYFFQSTHYDLVIVEDLDRFDDSDIFVTLREINSLVNGNVGVKRQVRFLYALRDDMFANTDRTKFFEFIVPVVPIINSSNSIDMVLAQGKRVELDRRLDQQFLREVSRYLSDLRLIHNIFNEYEIYVANLETDGEKNLDPTKLLAVLIYKNVYPKDFEGLHRGEGNLAGIFGRKDELIAEGERSYRLEIVELEGHIEAAEQQIPKDLRELRRIYVMTLIEALAADTISVGRTMHERIPLRALTDHKDIDAIIASPNLNQWGAHNHRTQHNNSTLQQTVDTEVSYAERVRSIEQKAGAHKKTAHNRIAELRHKIKVIRTSKFNILLRSGTQQVKDLFENFGDDGGLARFLLLEGYLDDSYYQYISLFHSGRLSPNDNKFLIQIRSFNTPEPTFPIDNPSEVIAGMREDDFSLDYALNVWLVDALLESKDHKERLGRVFSYLSSEFLNQQDFFEAYYAVGSHVAEFLVQLANAWRGFVPAVIDDSSGTLHIARLIEHLPPNMLARECEEHPALRTFVANNLRDILDLVEGLDPVKLEELRIKAKDLSAIDGYPHIARKLYELGYYVLNNANLDYIFGSILGEETGLALRMRHYTAVRRSRAQPLIARVENEFDAYFALVLLNLDDDVEEDIDAILAVMSHDEIDAQQIETFVLRQTKLLPTFKEVPPRFQAMVFRRTRIVPNWSNCLAFIQSENWKSDALIAFLGDEETRSAILETPIPESQEALPLRQFLFNAEHLTDIAYRDYIRALPREFEKFPDAVGASKRHILIEEHRVTFNAENLAELDGDIDLQTAFVAQNIASYLCAPDSFSVDDGFRERLLSSDILDDEKREVIGLMDLSSLPNLPERAGIVGPILLRTNCTLPSLTADIVKAIIVHARPVSAQIRLLNLLNENLNKNEVREVLGQLPGPYSKIQTGYARPALRRTNENSELVRWLDERGIISSIGASLWSTDIIVHLYRA
ncbi:ATP-binding protein [Rhodobacteraceae bacterium]|nr:ATP-binding protein [Paracoccaceae bacterium]